MRPRRVHSACASFIYWLQPVPEQAHKCLLQAVGCAALHVILDNEGKKGHPAMPILLLIVRRLLPCDSTLPFHLPPPPAQVVCRASSDFTCKQDVTGLKAGVPYTYSFTVQGAGGGAVSPTGRFKLPYAMGAYRYRSCGLLPAPQTPPGEQRAGRQGHGCRQGGRADLSKAAWNDVIHISTLQQYGKHGKNFTLAPPLGSELVARQDRSACHPPNHTVAYLPVLHLVACLPPPRPAPQAIPASAPCATPC